MYEKNSWCWRHLHIFSKWRVNFQNVMKCFLFEGKIKCYLILSLNMGEAVYGCFLYEGLQFSCCLDATISRNSTFAPQSLVLWTVTSDTNFFSAITRWVVKLKDATIRSHVCAMWWSMHSKVRERLVCVCVCFWPLYYIYCIFSLSLLLARERTHANLTHVLFFG